MPTIPDSGDPSLRLKSGSAQDDATQWSVARRPLPRWPMVCDHDTAWGTRASLSNATWSLPDVPNRT